VDHTSAITHIGKRGKVAAIDGGDHAKQVPFIARPIDHGKPKTDNVETGTFPILENDLFGCQLGTPISRLGSRRLGFIETLV
jgi:hypothetical protein